MKFVAITIALIAYAGPGSAFSLENAVEESGLAPEVFRAIAERESMRSDAPGGPRPWPWVVRDREGAFYFESRQDAAAHLRQRLDNGWTNVDVGGMQVSVRWHQNLVRSPEDLLDPAVNLWAATQVLVECRRRFGSELRAITGCYHAGHPGKAHAQTYSNWVVRRARELGNGND